MTTYPVIHLKTGQKKELRMSMLKYDEWRKDNPEWDKDWSAGCAGVGEVGDWQNKLVSRNPGWNDVLRKAAKAPGSKVRPIT